MKRNIKQLCWRGCLTFVEVVTVLFAVAALCSGILMWRVAASPLDVSFIKPAVERALRNDKRGIYTRMDQVVLHWPDLSGPLLLGLRNTHIYGPEDTEILSIDEVGLALSKSHLLVGEIAPTSIILRKPVLQVLRKEDGGIDIGFGSMGGDDTEPRDITAHAHEQTELMARILEFVAKPGEEDAATPLATLHAFEIQEAKVSVKDRVLNLSWFIPRFDVAFVSTQTGLKSSLFMHLPEWRGKSGTLKADMNYGWEDKTTMLRARVENMDVSLIGEKFPQLGILSRQDIPLNFSVDATLDGDFVPVTLKAEAVSPQGSLDIPEVSHEPLPYSNMAFSVAYDGSVQSLKISDARIMSKGVLFNGEADFKRNEEGQVAGPVNVWIDELSHSQIAPLWPEIARGENAEDWILHRMSDGVFRDVRAGMNVTASEGAEGWAVETSGMTADFDYENLTVDYRAPLWAVKNAKGHGHFDYDKEELNVAVEEGMIDNLTVQKGSVELRDIIAVGKGVADINVKLTGPLASALDYAALEPVELPHGFDTKKVKGTVNLDVSLNLPTRHDVKVADVKVDIKGQANDVLLPDVLRGLALESGPFDISVKGNEAKVSGTGKLSGRDIDLTWMEFLNSKGQKYTGKITAKLAADPELRRHFGVDLDDFVEGAVPVSVDYTEYADKSADAYFVADLSPARLFIEPFAYEKPAGAKGEVKGKALFRKGELSKIENLIGTAPSLMLEDSTLVFEKQGQDTQLRRGQISRFTLGETVGKAEFEIEPAQSEKPGALKISLIGPFFDLRPFLDSGKNKDETEYDGVPMVVSIAADQMRTGDDEIVQYGKIYADIDGKGRFNQLEVDAIAGKGKAEDGSEKPGEVYLRFKPDEEGKRTFRLEADDAGATLKAFQVYDNIVGGKLVVYAEPIRGVYDRNLIGVAEITDFKVVKAPGLARLLGAMSLTGIIELLGNEGVSFSKLESKFDWLYRPQGGLLVLKEGRTSGNSLGLTFDGAFDNTAGTIDVSGTLVPLSGVNNVVGSIPLIGDLLTGGSGSLFAATYKVTGSAEEPDVSVNPLSVLAPGFLRRILFE